MKELKILMLHGFTQSGPSFHAKTKGLEKFLTKSLAPLHLLPRLIYPTAATPLSPSDVPNASPDDQRTGHEGSMFAWFRKTPDAGTLYRLFDEGTAPIERAIRDARGVHAVCGFSQGAAVAVVVAAALDPQRIPPKEAGWAHRLRDANKSVGPLFAVSWAGFRLSLPQLDWVYEPSIGLPTLHYIGSLDTVVEEKCMRDLVDVCGDAVVLVHPGGHFVPVVKQWVAPLAGFIAKHAKDADLLEAP